MKDRAELYIYRTGGVGRVIKDPQKALDILKKAAELGNKTAMRYILHVSIWSGYRKKLDSANYWERREKPVTLVVNMNTKISETVKNSTFSNKGTIQRFDSITKTMHPY
ncbi:SEL1-like repeat protein [Acinetobacter baumannii]